ncbi:MAG: hypothetical protein K2I18_02565 [Paramuribaculum sp.]|nr:hypothetical protein [Paramuribaculum sp.]
METVVMIIMLLVGMSFVLKLTCHSWAGIAALSILSAAFVGFANGFASQQSKTRIADWLGRPELMLDTSVLLTVDIFIQIFFCVLMARKLAGTLGRKGNIALQTALWFPGLLIFPVLFSLLVEVVFAMPGVDFGVIGWSTAAFLLMLMPLAAIGLKWLLPEVELRIELMFLINLLIAALGVVATVNGRTAATGTSSVEWGALAAVFGLLCAGGIAGIFYDRIITKKQISKLQ